MATEPAVQTATRSGETLGLRGNSVGTVGVLFQSVTLMGPGVAVAVGSAVGVTYAGGSFPLALALALVGCLLLAINIGQLALHLPTAGGYYTFISRGLGRTPGFLAGWLAIPAYLLFIPLSLIAFGFAVQSLSNGSAPWYVVAVIVAIVMALLTFFGVRPSLRTLVVMGAIEIGVFILLSIFLVVRPAPFGNTLQAFTPAQWPNGRGGLSGGLSGVLVGTVIAFLFFNGFESAAVLGEESRDPRRTIPRAMLLAVVAIGVFFVFVSYAGLAGYGFNHIGTTQDPSTLHTFLGAQPDNQPSPWFILGKNAWGTAGKYIIGLVILNSLAANIGAGYVALSRVTYAMGRAGALPAAFGKVSRRFRTPALPLALAALVSVGVAVAMVNLYGQPPNSFYVLVNFAGFAVLLAYSGVSLAVPFYYLRERRAEFNVLRHIVVPALTIGLLVVVLLAQIFAAPLIDNFPGLQPQYLGGLIAGGWLLIGIIWALVLRARRPAALEAGERIYVEAGEQTR